MKKSLAIVILVVLIVSGCGVVTSSFIDPRVVEKTDTLSFSSVQLLEENDYTNIGLSEATSYLTTPGGYALPVMTRVYTFPFLTKITDVVVSYSEIKEKTISKPLKFAPQPIADNTEGSNLVSHQSTSFKIYPEDSYSYHIAAGRDGDNLVTYLAVHLYPVQYLPSDNTLRYAQNAKISIMYMLPDEKSTKSTDQYELVIIAPEAFSEALQPLVSHKISKGMTTKLVTLEDIYQSVYFLVEGRDCAEEMKYFIKNAFDQWGTKYVLLVGGRNGGIMEEKWWVPVRYSLLNDGGESSYLTDLYFADVYDSNGNFSSWDSNNNGIFAEWTNTKKDILDMYPEVYVGRLPCTSVSQVKTMVDKIITYETTTAGKEWFKKMVVVGGDSAPVEGDPYYEGEEENKLALEYMTGFEGVRLWTSNGNFTGPQDVINGISAGCGFLFFDGHGNPMSWSTHPPNNESDWINGLQVKHMSKLKNGEQLPVTVCGGCHNGQFNTSLFNIPKGIIQEGFKYFKRTFFLGGWIPECWAWKLMSVKNGGSIATMAYAGLDWFAIGDYNQDSIPDCTQFYSGYTNTQFFKNYGVNKMTILGQAHSQALIDYLNAYPPMQEKLDCKTVQEFVLLGDPSLQIGGYS
jgi:hypothetical protein